MLAWRLADACWDAPTLRPMLWNTTFVALFGLHGNIGILKIVLRIMAACMRCLVSG